MQSYQDSDIDYALDVLAHPERELSDEFRAWIQDDAHRELYYSLKAAHDGLAMNELPLPDVEEQWARFLRAKGIFTPPHEVSVTPDNEQVGRKEKRRPHTFARRTWWQMAAAVALAFLLGGGLHAYLSDRLSSAEQPVALMEHRSAPQEVTLTTADGHHIALSEETDRDSLASLGTTMEDAQEIAYRATEETATQHTLSTPRGKDFKLVLHDGTEVWLNAESTLRYPSRFSGDRRVVELSGEAYFKVARDEARPFFVKSGAIETQVLGTSFNFRNYDHSTPHVTLVEGRVLVTGHNTSVTLRPNDDAQIHTDGTIRVTQVDPRNYTAWTEGYFYFDNATLEDIMRELGRWYNLTIRFENTRAMSYHFTFWARRTGSAEETLRLINGLGKVNAVLEDETLTIR